MGKTCFLTMYNNFILKLQSYRKYIKSCSNLFFFLSTLEKELRLHILPNSALVSSIPFFFPSHEDVCWRTNYLRSILSRDNRGSQKILTFIKGLFSNLYIHFVFFILIGFPILLLPLSICSLFFHVVKKIKMEWSLFSIQKSAKVRSTHQIMEEKEEKENGTCWITYLGSLFQWWSPTQLHNETPESITETALE